MMFLLSVAVLVAVSLAQDPKHSAPSVKVYSEKPGEYGSENTLVCHVSGFHPPDISIQLMKDDVELPFPKQTDLAFKQGWHFHLTKTVGFKPQSGEKYSCRVTHGDTVNNYIWEPNM